MQRRKDKCPVRSNAPAPAGRSAESPAACRHTGPGRANCPKSTSQIFARPQAQREQFADLRTRGRAACRRSLFLKPRGKSMLSSLFCAHAPARNRARNRLSKDSIAIKSMSTSRKPRIGITLGDCAGIGPEIVDLAVKSDRVPKSDEYKIIGK